jgi:hypothetical protein
VAGAVGPAGLPPDLGPIIERLRTEFAKELAEIRGQVGVLQTETANLGQRVTSLEQQPLSLEGSIDYRLGYAGTDIENPELFDDLDVRMGGAYNHGADHAAVDLRFNNRPLPLSELGPEIGEVPPSVWDSPGIFIGGYGNDAVWLTDAWYTRDLGIGRSVTLGRQYEAYGEGLIVDNQRRAQNGVRFHDEHLGLKGLSFDSFVGGSEYDFNMEPTPTSPPDVFGDGYIAGHLGWDNGKNLHLGATWLPDGVWMEQAWGVNAAWRWNQDKWLRFEYGQMQRHVNRSDFQGTHNPFAIRAFADLYRDKRTYLQGFYSYTDAEYDVQYSILHPDYEPYNPTPTPNMLEWERWLFAPPQVTNLWYVGGNLWTKFGTVPCRFTYYQVNQVSDFWANSAVGGLAFDGLWSVTVYHPLAKEINLGVTYAQQIADPDDAPTSSPPPVNQQLLMVSTEADF